MKTIGKILLLIILALICSFGLAADSQKRVLFISSYNASFPTFFNQINGIREELKDSFVIDMELMDSKNLQGKEYQKAYYESFRYKFQKMKKPDAIIVADDNAYNFIMENNENLFKNIPIVFIGVNTYENARRSDNVKNITGFVETPSMEETIDLACKLVPGGKNLVVILDGTTSGKGQEKNFQHVRGKYEANYDIEIIDLEELSFEEYILRLEELNEDDVVLLLSAYLDKNGDVMNFNEIVSTINTHVQVPVFHLWRYGVGEGLVGGKVISHYKFGSDAAKLVKDILEKKVDIEDILVKNNFENVYFFDHEVMQKYGLDEDLIPENGIIINQERNFYQENKALILSAITILIVMAFLIAGLMLNIRERKKKEEEIEELAFYDKLTGLPNRISVIKEVNNEYSLNKGGAILYFDIDNFKNINDVYGHTLGDKILVEVANLLNANLGEGNYIAKTAGDEFVIILKGTTNKVEINRYISNLLRELAQKLKIDEYFFYVTYSVGIAIYPYDGHDSEELFMNADMALHRAKDLGKNNYIFYLDSFNEGLKDKLDIQRELVDAIKEKELYVCFQPKYIIDSNSIMNYEALIRWNSNKLGFVSPADFIVVAEEMGIINEIGKFVLDESCKFINYMEKNGYKVGVSVNASINELNRETYLNDVYRIMDKYEINPKQIGLEVTEGILIKDFNNIKRILDELSSHGIKILLDDFGKGYSSLNYIRNLPIDVLKIDKSFIDNIETSKEERVLVKSIIEIAHVNSMDVIAEGVEKEEQLSILKSLGCDIVQGYLIAKPMKQDFIIESWKEIIESRSKN